MTTHMNLFEPYFRKEPHHEDALTRAFLLVLRNVPLAHASWLTLVDSAHRQNRGTGLPPLHELPEPDVEMQIGSVPDDLERLVSLVQTDDVYFRETHAAASARRQVLDGLVVYGDVLGIAIENKPSHANIRDEQLDVNVPEGVAHDQRVACVTWKDIVTAWGGLFQAGHLGRAECAFVEDFLDYVEEHFPALRPYSKVSLCGSDVGRLNRRSEAILREIAPEQTGYHRGWAYYIDLVDGQCAKKLAVFPSRPAPVNDLVLEVDPGDTVGQAKILFSKVVSADVRRLLEEKRWTVRPSFHLMFMSTGFFRPAVKLHALEYWSRWAEHRSRIRQWKREEFEGAFQALLEMGIAGPEDRAEFDRTVVNTKRGNIGFAPGLTVQWRLPLSEASALDDRDELIPEVRRAMERAAAVFQLKLPWTSSVAQATP
jgi:hypothetical protein